MNRNMKLAIFLFGFSVQPSLPSQKAVELSSLETFRQGLPERWREATGILYVTNESSNDVSALAVNDDGSLIPIPGSPFATGGSGPSFAQVSSDGKYLRVPNLVSDELTTFTISPSGSLAHACPPQFKTTVAPKAAELLRSNGRFRFSVYDNQVSVHRLNQNGPHTPVPGSPFTTGGQGALASAVVEPTRRLLFVANRYSNTISGFTIAESGSLTYAPRSPFATKGKRPTAMALHPNSNFLFVANSGSHNISVFSVDENGSLSLVPRAPFATGRQLSASDRTLNDHAPRMLTLDEVGRFLFVVSGTASNPITVFKVDPSSGVLTATPKSPFATGGSGPVEVSYIPLPQQWKNAQAFDIIATLNGSKNFKYLPEAIKFKIAQTKLGDTFKKEDIKQLFTQQNTQHKVNHGGVTLLTFEEVVAYLTDQHYDKRRIAGGLLHLVSSRFAKVERGTLTPKGFQLLDAWAKGKENHAHQKRTALTAIQKLRKQQEKSE